MNPELLNKLHCPYCGIKLELTAISSISSGEIINAVVECACSKYPVVEGILILKTLNPYLLSDVVSCLEKKEPQEALFILLEPVSALSRVVRALKSRHLFFGGALERGMKTIMRPGLKKMIVERSFTRSLAAVKGYSFAGYFSHRYACESFIAALPLIYLMEHSRGPILEIGSGMGHHAFVISRSYPQRPLTCVDISFANLYLSKKFFSPHSQYLCLDANDPLPFMDSAFGAVFSSDYLHYLRNKKTAFVEMERLLQAQDFMLCLSHLHNKDTVNFTCGYPLSAAGWLRLADRPECTKLFSQKNILTDFLSSSKLDLTNSLSENDHGQENAFSMIRLSDPDLFKCHDRIGERFFGFKDNLSVNPLYGIRTRGSQAILIKRWPGEFIRQENSIMDGYFAQSICLDKDLVRRLAQKEFLSADNIRVDELMRKFILIDLPDFFKDYA